MRKFLVTALLTIFMLFSSVYAASESITCEFKSSCSVNESELFYTHHTLSSNVRTLLDPTGSDSNYPTTLCCSSPIDTLDFTTISSASTCSGEEFMYFTGSTNARTAYEYNSAHHSQKMCAKTLNTYTDIDILAVEEQEANKYLSADYSCLYRTSSLVNGHMSSCGETFGSGSTYDYTVVGRVFDTLDTTPCNADCTSELDGRIYPGCRNKIAACSLMPVECEGSIVGAWVPFNSSHEIKCEMPWTVFREASFTTEGLSVETSAGECNNLINTEYTTIVNGEQVSLVIYSCQD